MSTTGQVLTRDRIEAREVAVKQYTHARLSAQEIAAKLGLSQRTVTRYRARLRRQTASDNRSNR